MHKEDVVYTHTHTGILLSHLKKIPVAAIWMDLEIIILSKSEKDKYRMI